MKVISIAAAGISLALIASTLLPSAGDLRPLFALGALICSAVAVVTIVAGWREQPAPVSIGSAPDPAPPDSVRAANAVRTPVNEPFGTSIGMPAPPSVLKPSGVAEVVSFLGTLQDKGRLVDFLQDDITGYSDAQVGVAARVVHQGCKTVINDYFRIVPIREEQEGAKVSVPAEYAAGEYRLVGKIGGQPPFSGTLVHRGWKTDSVTLPRVLHLGDDRLPTIAPAEVELR